MTPKFIKELIEEAKKIGRVSFNEDLFVFDEDELKKILKKVYKQTVWHQDNDPRY